MFVPLVSYPLPVVDKGKGSEVDKIQVESQHEKGGSRLFVNTARATRGHLFKYHKLYIIDDARKMLTTHILYIYIYIYASDMRSDWF